MLERIKKGKELTAVAIANKDHAALSLCMGQFLKIGAPVADICAAIAESPLSLLGQTGYCLRIYSSVLGREINIGTDIAWGTLETLIAEGEGIEGLKHMFKTPGLVG